MALTFSEWRREHHGHGTRAGYEDYLRTLTLAEAARTANKPSFCTLAFIAYRDYAAAAGQGTPWTALTVAEQAGWRAAAEAVRQETLIRDRAYAPARRT